MINFQSNKKLDFLAIFFLGIVLFTLGISHQEIISFESRFYLFAQNMLKNGPSLFPYVNSNPYPDYPGTSTFLIYLSACLLGGLNKLTAVLPSAIAAACTLAFTYLIGALEDRKWGIAAVFFLLFTAVFTQEARTISIDVYITLITTICFYIIFSAEKLNKYQRLGWLPLLLILGFLVRGPLGLIIPTGVISVFYLLEKRIGLLFFNGIIAFLLLILCCVFLLFLANSIAGPQFGYDVFHMQIFSRMGDSKAPPFYFYFIENFGTFLITYPLMLIMLFGFNKPIKNKKLLLQLLGWVSVILLGLSIPGDKKIRYVLPIAPALALFCGYLFVERQNEFLLSLKKYLLIFFTYLPLLSGILIGYCFFKKQCQLPYFELFITLAATQLLAFGKSEFLILFSAITSFLIILIFVIEPINLQLNQAKDFVQRVELTRHVYNAKLIFYRENEDGLPIKYLINMSQAETPLFFNQPEQLQNFDQSAFYITKQENFKSLPPTVLSEMKVIAQGRMGRENMVVFQKGHA